MNGPGDLRRSQRLVQIGGDGRAIARKRARVAGSGAGAVIAAHLHG